MTVSKSLALVLLVSSFWLTAQATQTRTGGPRAQAPAPARPKTTQDELARHVSAAETYQLSGDLKGAAVENRAIIALALRRLGTIAIRTGQFQRALQLLGDSLALGDEAGARTDLAIAHMRLLQVEEAMAAAQAAVKLDEKGARAHHVTLHLSAAAERVSAGGRMADGNLRRDCGGGAADCAACIEVTYLDVAAIHSMMSELLAHVPIHVLEIAFRDRSTA